MLKKIENIVQCYYCSNEYKDFFNLSKELFNLVNGDFIDVLNSSYYFVFMDFFFSLLQRLW